MPVKVILWLMIWLYRLLFLPVFIVLFFRNLPRLLRRGGYGRDFKHRLGFLPRLPAKRTGVRRIWLQAVSVGEVVATEPLLRELAAGGQNEVILTTTTSTGYAVAREKLAPLVLATGLFPFDFWPCVALAWRRIQPDILVLMEGELWPEHLAAARARGVPAVVINARLSDRTFRRYQRFPRVAKFLFGSIKQLGVGTHEDARRLHHLGLPAEKIILTGNLKFDASAGGSNPNSAAGAPPALTRADLGFSELPTAPILLGSSTWPGEEKMLIETLRQARRRGIPLRLLLVPRHAERREEIRTLLAGSDWAWHFRSELETTPEKTMPEDTDVCVADTTGELARLTRLATVAFIGKSLPPNNGGQSPFDAAAAGVPIVYGPLMTNFRDACRGLQSDGAAIRVNHEGEAVSALLELLEDPERRAKMSAAGRRWHTDNQGATKNTLALLNALP
jgi:3-deoxy-D-manno-octulosonic-acid transferase